MNIRCLVGHDYGDPQTSRSREERGNEAVVTVLEYVECTRCGHRRVLSENKEVTAVQPESPADDEESPPSRTPAADTEEYTDVTAEEDDGVILEDEREAEERERGEWPEEPVTDPADAAEEEPRAWPDVDGEDEGYAAAPADGGPVEDVEFHGSLTPESEPTMPDDESPSGETVGVEVEGGGDDTGEELFRRSGPGPSPTQRQRPDGVDTEFVCPECGHTAPSQGSSLRPGDICPECRRGYLSERERSE